METPTTGTSTPDASASGATGGSTAAAAIHYTLLREAYRLVEEVRAKRPDLVSEEVSMSIYRGSSKAWVEAGQP